MVRNNMRYDCLEWCELNYSDVKGIFKQNRIMILS